MDAITKVERVYLAGPMAGVEEFNAPLFNAMAHELREQGFEVVNPVDLDLADEVSALELWLDDGEGEFTVSTRARAHYMSRDLPEVAQCGAVALLPDWQGSVGANIELLVALVCGLEVWEFVETVDGLVAVYSDPNPDLIAIAAHIEALRSVMTDG